MRNIQSTPIGITDLDTDESYDTGENYKYALEELSRDAVRTLTLGSYTASTLNNAAIKDLAGILQGSTSLRKLTFEGCEVMDSLICALFSELSYNKTLTEISFIGNATCANVTDKGALFIAAYLETNPSLRSLVIEDSGIGMRGGINLARALGKNNTICQFHIGTKENIMSAEVLWRQAVSSSSIISFSTPPFPGESWYEEGVRIVRERRMAVLNLAHEWLEYNDEGKQFTSAVERFREYSTAIKATLDKAGREDLVGSFDRSF